MNSIYVANAFKQTQLAWINMQLRSYTCKRKPFVLKGTSSCPASATREEHQFSQTMDGHTWHVRNTFVEVVSDASSTSGTECRRSRSERPSEVGRLTTTPMKKKTGLRRSAGHGHLHLLHCVWCDAKQRSTWTELHFLFTLGAKS